MAVTDDAPTTRSIDGIELSPKEVGLELPPTFDTVEEERHYRKTHLAGALRIFGRFGFSEGVAGHITVRDPERTDHFWVTGEFHSAPPRSAISSWSAPVARWRTTTASEPAR